MVLRGNYRGIRELQTFTYEEDLTIVLDSDLWSCLHLRVCTLARHQHPRSLALLVVAFIESLSAGWAGPIGADPIHEVPPMCESTAVRAPDDIVSLTKFTSANRADLFHLNLFGL